jgi:hypothetical protein
VLKSVAMRELFCNGRHLRIHMSCAVQYLMDMDPSLRTNVDYVVAMREKIMMNRVKLHKYFFGVFPQFKDFNKVFEKCTAEYSAIVMDNTSRSSRPEDCIFWYRAQQDVGHFRMGKEIFWRLSEQHAKSDEQKRREEVQREEQEREEDRNKRKKNEPLLVTVQDELGNWVGSTAHTVASRDAPRIQL